MKIAVSVSSSRSVPFFQSEGCHWFAVRGQGNTHDTAGFCHKAHPSDAVLLTHGMENVSNLDCHVESVLFHYRKMFSAAPSVAAGSRISKGLQESGRAALGAGERASNTILWFLSVRNTGSFFMKILRSQSSAGRPYGIGPAIFLSFHIIFPKIVHSIHKAFRQTWQGR